MRVSWIFSQQSFKQRQEDTLNDSLLHRRATLSPITIPLTFTPVFNLKPHMSVFGLWEETSRKTLRQNPCRQRENMQYYTQKGYLPWIKSSADLLQIALPDSGETIFYVLPCFLANFLKLFFFFLVLIVFFFIRMFWLGSE